MLFSKIIQSTLLFAFIGIFVGSMVVPVTASAATSKDGLSIEALVGIGRDSGLSYLEDTVNNKASQEAKAQFTKLLTTCSSSKTTTRLLDCLNSEDNNKTAQYKCEKLDRSDNSKLGQSCTRLFNSAHSVALREIKKAEKSGKIPETHAPTKIKPNTYGKCLTYFKGAKLSAIQKNAKKLQTQRSGVLDQLQEKANNIKTEKGKTAALKGISEDRMGLSSYASNISSNKGDANKYNEEAVANYCMMIFKLQISRNRTHQVYALLAADKALRSEKSMQKLLANPVNKSTDRMIAKNPFKADIEKRLTASATLAAQNIEIAKSLTAQAMNAKMSETAVGSGEAQDYKSSLKNPAETIKQLGQNRTTIWRNYNEAQVLKVGPNAFSPEYKDKLKLNSIALMNKDRNTIKPDGTVVLKSVEVSKEQTQSAKDACKDKKKAKEIKSCVASKLADIKESEQNEQSERASNKPVYALINVSVGTSKEGAAFKKHSQHGKWIVTNPLQ